MSAIEVFEAKLNKVVDRREIAVSPTHIDLDVWHPGDKRWMRGLTIPKEVWDAGEQPEGTPQIPEQYAIFQYYPTRYRYVVAGTGEILDEGDVDHDLVVQRMLPKIDPLANRAERRATAKQLKETAKLTKRELKRRAKGG
jgi:hypothetical protein